MCSFSWSTVADPNLRHSGGRGVPLLFVSWLIFGPSAGLGPAVENQTSSLRRNGLVLNCPAEQLSAAGHVGSC